MEEALVGGWLDDGGVLSDCGRDVMTEFVQIKLYTKGGIFYCMKMYTLIFLMERKREWVDSSMKEKWSYSVVSSSLQPHGL